MTSDFLAARLHLERAAEHLRGEDDTSREARKTLELLIETVMAAEHRPQPAQVIPLHTGAMRRGRR